MLFKQSFQADSSLFAHLVQFFDAHHLNMPALRQYFSTIKNNSSHILTRFVEQVKNEGWGLPVKTNDAAHQQPIETNIWTTLTQKPWPLNPEIEEYCWRISGNAKGADGKNKSSTCSWKRSAAVDGDSNPAEEHDEKFDGST